MDDKLKTRLLKISQQIAVLYKAEEAYLTLDAAKDHKFACIMNDAPESLTSEASRATWAKSRPEWFLFKKNLAQAKAEFDKQEHILGLKNKAFDAESKTYSIENQAIRRGVE